MMRPYNGFSFMNRSESQYLGKTAHGEFKISRFYLKGGVIGLKKEKYRSRIMTGLCN